MSKFVDVEIAKTILPIPKECRSYQTDNIDDAYEQGWFDALNTLEKLSVHDGIVDVERLIEVFEDEGDDIPPEWDGGEWGYSLSLIKEIINKVTEDSK